MREGYRQISNISVTYKVDVREGISVCPIAPATCITRLAIVAGLSLFFTGIAALQF